MEYNYISQMYKIFRRMPLCYIFVNQFNEWISRRQWDSHNCCSIQSLVILGIK